MSLFETTSTLAGSEVRIYARDVGPDKEIHGAYRSEQDWYIASWKKDGHYYRNENKIRALDLVESQPPVVTLTPDFEPEIA